MNPQGAQNYLRTRVLTATPEQLQMMLYDGAIRFIEQARPALENKNWEVSYTMISRAQKIVAELISSMRHDVAPEMCKQLASLYNYIYRKLVEANTAHQIDSLDEAQRLLKYQRDTWALLMEKLAREMATAAASKMQVPPPSRRMEASLSMQG